MYDDEAARQILELEEYDYVVERMGYVLCYEINSYCYTAPIVRRLDRRTWLCLHRSKLCQASTLRAIAQ